MGVRGDGELSSAGAPNALLFLLLRLGSLLTGFLCLADLVLGLFGVSVCWYL